MKTYIIAAAIIAIVGLIPGVYFTGYFQGKAAAVADYQQAALQHRERENVLLEQLDKAKKELKIVYLDRIKVVKEAADVCLDSPVPESISGLLHDASAAKTQPAADKGL